MESECAARVTADVLIPDPSDDVGMGLLRLEWLVAPAIALSLVNPAQAAKPIPGGHYLVHGRLIYTWAASPPVLHVFRRGDEFTETSFFRVQGWRCGRGQGSDLDEFFELSKTTWGYRQRPVRGWKPVPPLKIRPDGSFSATRTEGVYMEFRGAVKRYGTRTLAVHGRFKSPERIAGRLAAWYDDDHYRRCSTGWAPFTATYAPAWRPFG